MRLGDLIEVLGDGVLERVGGDPEVRAVTHDSRGVVPGALFCCVPGGESDGHRFAPAAVAAGAGALLVERRLDGVHGAAQVRVASTREAMAPVAARFHGDPSRHLDVVGITGTNGKTTTVHLLSSVLEAAGRHTGEIGTLTGARTTPEAPDLQARLAEFRDEGCSAVAMEVSSHALAAHRVDATRFVVAAFTNLSRDHLDFHETMEQYFEAKALLFAPGRGQVAVVDVDGEWGVRLADRIAAAGSPQLVRVSLGQVTDLDVTLARCRFGWRGEQVDLPLGGRHNASNALLAAEIAVALGIGPDVVAAGLAAVPPVSGRFERVEEGQPFDVIVDYAHTPDGLAKVLDGARTAVGTGRVLVVFGCGGDRDRSKRPEMGRVAAAAADQVVVTSDNPRGEAPEAIIRAVIDGIPDPTHVRTEPDRRAAIALALAEADAGDVVVIAGKGHETTQEEAGVRTPFDDREVARDLLRSSRGRGGEAARP
jgi:UDP-N-acetylmuramoyl-L-alanyl-D-glutamate--2,6-diaminopimelate ligase